VASKSLVKRLKMLWENWRASVWCDLSRVVLCCVVSRRRVSLFVVPRGRGVRLPFIDQGESESHACRAI
jgi:hypothetical protein